MLRYYPTATETFVHDEVAGLRERGVDVAIAAFDRREDVGTPPAAPVWSQPHRWGWLGALPALVLEWLRAPGRVSPRVLWLASRLRRAGVRRVHAHFAGEAARWARAACVRAGVPYSLTVHAADLYKPMDDLPVVLAGAVRVATVSACNRAVLHDRYGIDSDVLRCGVRLPPPRAPRAGATPRLVTVARHVPKKGLDVLVEALRRLGRPVEAHAWTNAPSLPGVEVHAFAPHAEVLAGIASADVFVLPCRIGADGDRDGIPVVLLEALAAGVPVVTTPVSGIPEVVDEAVGWLVPPDDPEALAGALRAALDDPAEAARRGARGPARLRDRGFDREATMGHLVAWLDADGRRG